MTKVKPHTRCEGTNKGTGKNGRAENMLVQTPEGILVNGMLDWDRERRGRDRGRQDGVES